MNVHTKINYLLFDHTIIICIWRGSVYWQLPVEGSSSSMPLRFQHKGVVFCQNVFYQSLNKLIIAFQSINSHLNEIKINIIMLNKITLVSFDKNARNNDEIWIQRYRYCNVHCMPKFRDKKGRKDVEELIWIWICKPKRFELSRVRVTGSWKQMTWKKEKWWCFALLFIQCTF